MNQAQRIFPALFLPLLFITLACTCVRAQITYGTMGCMTNGTGTTR